MQCVHALINYVTIAIQGATIFLFGLNISSTSKNRYISKFLFCKYSNPSLNKCIPTSQKNLFHTKYLLTFAYTCGKNIWNVGKLIHVSRVEKAFSDLSPTYQKYQRFTIIWWREIMFLRTIKNVQSFHIEIIQ